MSRDIVDIDDDVVIGRHWHGPETWMGETFRWVTNDATLFLPTTRRSEYDLSLEVEAGPSIEGLGASLILFDTDGTRLAEHPLGSRRFLSATLPAAKWPVMHELRLHCDRTGAPLANDGRILTFRCFSVASRIVPPDLFGHADPFSLGFGWYEQEFVTGDVFRWVSEDAEIVWHESDAKEIVIDVEPGPGLRDRSCTFVVDVVDGARLFDTVLTERTRIRIPRPERVPSTIRLNVIERGVPLAEDARILKFRVFRIGAA